MFFMLQGLVHMLQALVQVLQGLVQVLQGLQHKMYRGRNYFLQGVRKNLLASKKYLLPIGCGKICSFSCVFEKLFIILRPVYEKTRN